MGVEKRTTSGKVKDFFRGFGFVLLGAAAIGVAVSFFLMWIVGQFNPVTGFQLATLIGVMALLMSGGELALSLLFQYQRPMEIKFVEFIGGASAIALSWLIFFNVDNWFTAEEAQCTTTFERTIGPIRIARESCDGEKSTTFGFGD